MSLVCTLCGSAATLADDGYWRHANPPHVDASTFCDKYGYPIQVRESDTEVEKLRAELVEARNEAAVVRRAYLHEKKRAEDAIQWLRTYEPGQASVLDLHAYKGPATVAERDKWKWENFPFRHGLSSEQMAKYAGARVEGLDTMRARLRAECPKLTACLDEDVKAGLFGNPDEYAGRISGPRFLTGPAPTAQELRDRYRIAMAVEEWGQAMRDFLQRRARTVTRE